MKSVLTREKQLAIADYFSLPHDRRTIRRVTKAYDLYVRGLVEKNGSPNHYEVKSQSRRDVIHHVHLTTHGGCTCEDWLRANRRVSDSLPVVDYRCKHLLATCMFVVKTKREVAR